MMMRFCLCVISIFMLISSFTCSSSPIESESEELPRGNWIQAYLLADKKTFLVHTSDRIEIDDLCIDDELYVKSASFKGIELKAPISLKRNVTKSDFTKALLACGLLSPSRRYLSML